MRLLRASVVAALFAALAWSNTASAQKQEKGHGLDLTVEVSGDLVTISWNAIKDITLDHYALSISPIGDIALDDPFQTSWSGTLTPGDYIAYIAALDADGNNVVSNEKSHFSVEHVSQPPTVVVSASQSEIWPPNGKTVDIIFTVSIASDSALNGAEWTFNDEYGELSTSGTIKTKTPDPSKKKEAQKAEKGGKGEDDGSDQAETIEVTITLSLVAARDGNDADGRLYTFSANASNDAGSGSDSVTVTVPHDQGKGKGKK